MNRVGRFCPPCPPSSPVPILPLIFYLLLITVSLDYFIIPTLPQVNKYKPLYNNTMSANVACFPAITFSSINCSSLNMSAHSSSHHKLKLYGITKLKSDFIFLSDIRLGSKSLIGNSITTLENTFLVNPYCAYTLYAHSTRSSRGVGILVKKSLSISVLAEARDEDQNIRALHRSLAGIELTH